MQSAQRNTHILALHGFGNTFPQTGLAHPRRAEETENRRLQTAAQLKDGNVLKNALLHFLHTIVVLVKNAFRTLQVKVVLGIFIPGQIDHRLQIVHLYTVIRALRIQCVQLVQLLLKGLGNIIRPLLGLGLFYQFLLVGGGITVTQFLLDVLDLLVQEVFTLLLVKILPRL